MDWTAIIQEIGGGLPAVVIAALAYVCWVFWKRINALVDRAMEREREHSTELSATIRAVEQAQRAMEGRS